MDFLCVKIWVAFRFDHLKIIFNKLSEVSNPYLLNPKLLIDRGYLCSLRQEQNKRGFNILFVKLIDGDKKISDVFITPSIMTRGYQSNIGWCSVMNIFCCLHHKLWWCSIDLSPIHTTQFQQSMTHSFIRLILYQCKCYKSIHFW